MRPAPDRYRFTIVRHLGRKIVYEAEREWQNLDEMHQYAQEILTRIEENSPDKNIEYRVRTYGRDSHVYPPNWYLVHGGRL